ncbi:BnaC02g02560D [Brassica napus]|uniref:BnaC02g02560D protein n=1 Tax=Brassica napus TaxID=3708 RepID=A0A078FMP9_BRANA|nr:BnaC02g02560D [Brassica napus]
MSKKPGNLPDDITYKELPARTIPCEAYPQGPDCLQVKNVMIIAGDGDFGNLLSTSMKKKNVNLMLAYPEKGSALLKDEARTTFKWTVERSFDAPELMINGGRG